MKPSEVREKRKIIKRKMDALTEQLAQLQKACPHKNTKVQLTGNTDGYTECQDCGELWD